MTPTTRDIEDEVREVITASVTSMEGRTVDRPASAARYATNALLHHHPKLLARAAVGYARAEVEALLAQETP